MVSPLFGVFTVVFALSHFICSRTSRAWSSPFSK